MIVYLDRFGWKKRGYLLKLEIVKIHKSSITFQPIFIKN